jgi:hypothetical protein
MAKENERTQPSWIRNMWPILSFLIVQLVGFVWFLASLNSTVNNHIVTSGQRFEAILKEVQRVDQHGCVPSFKVRERLSAMDNENSNIKNTLAEIKQDIKEIKQFLMNPPG